VLDLCLRATIGEAGREPPNQTDRPIGRAEQQQPASEVLSPPSNAAITWRPSTTSYPNRSRLHCVGIGELLRTVSGAEGRAVRLRRGRGRGREAVR
jgi:hypothetical protein